MWNSLKKSERGHAQVSGIRKDHGRFFSRLTSPPHGRAFFAPHSRRGKAPIVVVCIVEKLGKVRPTCFARTMLFTASDSLSSGDVTKAGVQLREAVTRLLVSLCEYHDCTPKKKQLRTPAIMNRALLKVGGVDRGIYDWMREIIEYGNRCAHCQPVRGSLIETSISIMYIILDNSPEVHLPERQGVAL